ncbi:MAG: hypothetical protein AAFR54_17860 [Planctomycetota bacterium]
MSASPSSPTPPAGPPRGSRSGARAPGLDPRLARILARWSSPTLPQSALSRLRGLVGLTSGWCADQLVLGDARETLRPERLLTARGLLDARSSTVQGVVSERASDWKAPTVARSRRGRIVCLLPDATLADGAAELESGGFFDADDVPPAGTWLAYFEGADVEECLGGGSQGILLAWVPEDVDGRAAAGLEVCAGGALVWLRDAPAPFPELEPLVADAASRSAAAESAPDWLRRLPLLGPVRGV